MKNFLLLILATMSCASVFAEWVQCRNCGRHYDNRQSAASSDYCAKNACQRARHQEMEAKAKREAEGIAGAVAIMNSESKERHDVVNTVKSNAPLKEKVKALEKISFQFSNLMGNTDWGCPTWMQIVFKYGNMDLVKSCWPSAENKAVYEKSINKNSRSKFGVAFSLGKHKKTGETRFVYDNVQGIFRQVIIMNRYDVLEYFIGQMDGINCSDLKILEKALLKVNDELTSKKNTATKKLKSLETELANAADQREEEKIKNAITKVKATLANLNKKTISPKIWDILFKHVDDKLLEQYARERDEETNDYLYQLKQREASLKKELFLKSNFIYTTSGPSDRLKYDVENAEKMVKRFSSIGEKTIFAFPQKRFEKYQQNFKTIKHFTWKSGMPNVKSVGVLSGQQEGSWVAAPGFVMQADGTAKWKPGLTHPKYKNIVSAEKIFNWLPAPEHVWLRPKDPYCLKAGTIKDSMLAGIKR